MPYVDPTAGWSLITQSVTINQRTFTRTAIDANTWNAWVDLKGAIDSKPRMISSGSAPSGVAETGTIWQYFYSLDGIGYIDYYEYNGSSWVPRTNMASAGYMAAAISPYSSTNIVQGLVLSNFFGVKDETGQLAGYISGYQGNPLNPSVLLAGGVQYAGLANETRAVSIHHNGNININWAGDPRLTFNAATGALTVKGRIESSEGLFGGWNITSAGLSKTSPGGYGSSYKIINLKSDNAEIVSYKQEVLSATPEGVYRSYMSYDPEAGLYLFNDGNWVNKYAATLEVYRWKYSYSLGSYIKIMRASPGDEVDVALRVGMGMIHFDNIPASSGSAGATHYVNATNEYPHYSGTPVRRGFVKYAPVKDTSNNTVYALVLDGADLNSSPNPIKL